MCDEAKYQTVLSKLQYLRRTRRGWSCYCPVHENDGQRHRPSMSVWVGDNGALVLRCWVCRATFQQIATALALKPGDFFPPDDFTNHTPKRPMSEKLIAEYDYFDENNTYQFTVCRYEPKTFRAKRRGQDGTADEWGTGDAKIVLYKLPELLAADPRTPVYIVEGEKDVDRLRAAGFVATCNPFGAGKWRPQYVNYFIGKWVVVVADNDEPGERHAKEVVNSLLGKAKGVKLIRFNGGYGPKADVSTYFESGGTKAELEQIVKQQSLITEPFVLEPLTAQQPAKPESSQPPASERSVAAAQPSRVIAVNPGTPKEPATQPHILDRIATAAGKLTIPQRLTLVQLISASVALELSKSEQAA